VDAGVLPVLGLLKLFLEARGGLPVRVPRVLRDHDTVLISLLVPRLWIFVVGGVVG
jgi:hypothetical protein